MHHDQQMTNRQAKQTKAGSSLDVGAGVYKPCQRYAVPPEHDPLRKFYVSLITQKPNSKMAFKWCLEHGLLPEHMLDEHMRLLESASKQKVTRKQNAKAAAKLAVQVDKLRM